MTDLITVENLRVTFTSGRIAKRQVRAVDDVSFRIGAGETVGLIGESGSGKSTIGRAILGLTKPTSGRISLAGREITHASARERRSIARDVQVVFQDPLSSLNPSRTIGKTLAEPLQAVGGKGAAAAEKIVRDLLGQVGLPTDAMGRYASSFSGGQRQRIAIARALSVSPKLVICDEALSALDVVTQAQVLNLLVGLQRDAQLSYLFIAHNLPVVSYVADRVLVLYRGRIMEQGNAQEVHERPLHPYSQALRAAVAVPDVSRQRAQRESLSAAVSTDTARAAQPPVDGCPFAPRCPQVADVCWQRRPADTPVTTATSVRTVACHVFDASSGHPAALRDRTVA